MVILGVDPGLKATGVVVAKKKNTSFKITFLKEITTDTHKSLPERINFIFSSLEKIVNRFRPSILILEKIYSHHRHPTTLGLLGYVRGVILLLAAKKNIKVFEYPSTQVKKAVTSSGAASKQQVKKMVGYLLKLDKPLGSQHIADALALVLTYLHTQTQVNKDDF